MENDNDVQFEEDTRGSEFDVRSRELINRKQKPKLVQYLLQIGVVKTEQQASSLVLFVAAIFVIVSGWVFTTSLSHPANLYVTNQYGQQVPYEVYVDNIKNGENPLQYN